MSDKDYLEEYLLLLKSNIEVYIHGTVESSNKMVRDSLYEGLSKTLESQEDTFNLMMSKDYYVVDNIDPSEIEKTVNKLS